MDGRKVVIAIFALVILMSAITFTVYMLTRQVDDEGEGVLVPNAVVVLHEASQVEPALA